MAIWVYHGPAQYVKSSGDATTIYLRDGEYFEATEFLYGQNHTTIRGNVYENGWKYVELNFAASTNASTVSFGIGGNGYLRRLSRANSIRWGAHNYHPESGGNYYTLRRDSTVYTSSGSYDMTLQAGDQVIIGQGFEYFSPGNSKIRIWGYRTKESKAAWGNGTGGYVETTGLYVQEYAATKYPTSYNINTI